MPPSFLPPLPGVDPATAPGLDDPGYEAWFLQVAISPEGVDRMQIWEMLHATPGERLEAIETLSREMSALRHAATTARGE
ncbi:MAG: hypothetical protein ABI639_01300 [Thermoanaerobaculia bacterium]